MLCRFLPMLYSSVLRRMMYLERTVRRLEFCVIHAALLWSDVCIALIVQWLLASHKSVCLSLIDSNQFTSFIYLHVMYYIAWICDCRKTSICHRSTDKEALCIAWTVCQYHYHWLGSNLAPGLLWHREPSFANRQVHVLWGWHQTVTGLGIASVKVDQAVCKATQKLKFSNS